MERSIFGRTNTPLPLVSLGTIIIAHIYFFEYIFNYINCASNQERKEVFIMQKIRNMIIEEVNKIKDYDILMFVLKLLEGVGVDE